MSSLIVLDLLLSACGSQRLGLLLYVCEARIVSAEQEAGTRKRRNTDSSIVALDLLGRKERHLLRHYCTVVVGSEDL